MVGKLWSVSPSVMLDMHCFVGAGGGGSLLRGNGVLVHPSVSIGRSFGNQWMGVLQLGVVSLSVDEVVSPTIAFGIHQWRWRLYELP